MLPRSHDDVLFTDASAVGWGVHLPTPLGDVVVSDLWDATSVVEHINLKELRAVYLSLLLLGNRLAGRHVQLFCDNTTVVAILSKLYTKSRRLRTLLG
jgi:hypothetical protein